MNDKAYPVTERIFWAALALYLFVLPIAGTIAVRNLAFVALIAVTTAVLVKERRMPVLPFAHCWLAYFLVALVSVVFAVDPERSLSELRVEVVYCILIFIVGVTWGGRYVDFARFAGLLAVINLILTAASFSAVDRNMAFGEIVRIHPMLYAGLSGNWVLVVMFTNVWLAFLFWISDRKALSLLLGGLLVLDVWAMMATYNRQNLVALGAGLAVAGTLLLRMRFSWRRVGLFLGLLSIVAALLAAQLMRRSPVEIPARESAPSVAASLNQVEDVDGATTPPDVRWGLWKFSLQKIGEHPWIGGGIGRAVFDKLYPEYLPENPFLWHAHNMILNKGIQMGIPGMLVFVALWAALAMELLRHARSSGASGYLATAGFAAMVAMFTKNLTDDFFVRNVALSFWLVMGLMLGFLRADSVKATTRSAPMP